VTGAAYRAEAEALGELTLHPVDPARDAELLHGWVTQERARFWMMQDRSVEEVREIYGWIAEQPGQHAWLARLGGEPAALFQDYLPGDEEVGEHFDVQPGDRGVHFLMAPPGGPAGERRGYSRALLGFMVDFVFSDREVQRVVAEPDVRNEKSVGLLRRLGWELGEAVELSHKPAQLAFLTRERYEELRAGS
jgi:penicillin amidase